MPYIVTTKRPLSCTCWGRVEAKMCRACRKGGKDVSRRAVATLDDARLAARTVVVDSALAQGTTAGTTDAYDSAFALPESGGTVGPLPDGTVIDFELVEYADLWPYDILGANWQQRTIDAFNTKEAR